MKIPSLRKFALAAAIASTGFASAFATVDLNQYIHGGSADRPLGGTTTSAEDALDTSFDSYWRRVVEDVFNGRFSTFKPGLIIVVG
jgi:hypothetical protein